MQHVLKAWLVDNTITVDNLNDKILQLESSGNANLKDILELMQEEDTGLRPETLQHAITLYNRVVTDLLLRGVNVNTELFYAVAQLQGVAEKGVWNSEKNSIYVVFKQGKYLREEIAKTKVEILGEKAGVMYIIETEDRKTHLTDGSATAGRNLFVRGAMLKIVGDNEAVGVTLTDTKGNVTKLEEDLIASNKPSELTLLIPADLSNGEYTLTVTTQYTGGALLKSPRSASTTIWVGGKSTEGGSDVIVGEDSEGHPTVE